MYNALHLVRSYNSNLHYKFSDFPQSSLHFDSSSYLHTYFLNFVKFLSINDDVLSLIILFLVDAEADLLRIWNIRRRDERRGDQLIGSLSSYNRLLSISHNRYTLSVLSFKISPTSIVLPSDFIPIAYEPIYSDSLLSLINILSDGGKLSLFRKSFIIHDNDGLPHFKLVPFPKFAFFQFSWLDRSWTPLPRESFYF